MPTYIQLKSEGAIYGYTIYKTSEVKQVLKEIENKCNSKEEFNYIKRLAGFKNDFLVFLDDIYDFMVYMKKFNEIYNRSECTEYLNTLNKGVLSGQTQTVAYLFNRCSIFRKALESIDKLVEFNDMLNKYCLVRDNKGYVFVERKKTKEKVLLC